MLCSGRFILVESVHMLCPGRFILVEFVNCKKNNLIYRYSVFFEIFLLFLKTKAKKICTRNFKMKIGEISRMMMPSLNIWKKQNFCTYIDRREHLEFYRKKLFYQSLKVKCRSTSLERITIQKNFILNSYFHIGIF